MANQLQRPDWIEPTAAITQVGLGQKSSALFGQIIEKVNELEAQIAELAQSLTELRGPIGLALNETKDVKIPAAVIPVQKKEKTDATTDSKRGK